jgi:mRNA-degrading endonuclease RelE of RelBE toxin-antitoxin system
MFQIAFTPRALEHIDALKKYDQQRVFDAIQSQLVDQPDVESTNRKKLRPNGLAKWELRIGQLRVFYDVLEEDFIVKVVAVGYKVGNKLFLGGEEYKL